MQLQKIEKVQFCEGMKGCSPSFSKQDPGFTRGLVREGCKVYSPGNGWAYISIPSQILVWLNGCKINIAPFFREHLGRLTKKRVSAIIATAPREIVMDGSGINTTELHAWYDRVRVCASRRGC